jgi:hypothetical protein
VRRLRTQSEDGAGTGTGEERKSRDDGD